MLLGAFQVGASFLGIDLCVLEILLGDGLMFVKSLRAGEDARGPIVFCERLLIVGTCLSDVAALEFGDDLAGADVVARADHHLDDSSTGWWEHAHNRGGIRLNFGGEFECIWYKLLLNSLGLNDRCLIRCRL